MGGASTRVLFRARLNAVLVEGGGRVGDEGDKGGICEVSALVIF